VRAESGYVTALQKGKLFVLRDRMSFVVIIFVVTKNKSGSFSDVNCVFGNKEIQLTMGLNGQQCSVKPYEAKTLSIQLKYHNFSRKCQIEFVH
jgi:hypothetical protein